MEGAIADLRTEMDGFEQSLLELRVTAVEDRPSGGNRVAEAFGETAEDLLTTVRETVLSVERAAQSVVYPADLERLRHELTVCQQRHQEVLESLSTRLLAYDLLLELSTLAKAGPEWRAWCHVARDAAERCRGPVLRVNRALSACWMEIAEKARP